MAMILREAELAYTGRKIEASRQVRSARDAAAVFQAWGLGQKCQEHFAVMYLTAKHHVAAVQTVAMGGLTGVEIHPREVFRGAVMAGAAAVIIAHNHPSGDPTPSREDKELTARLRAAGELMGIPVLDHLVICLDIFHAISWDDIG